MNYYFYILECKNGNRYYGHTNNLARRVKEHANGEIMSTKNTRSINLVYFEELNSRGQAFKREMQFKNGKTRKETIDELINGFPKEKCQGFNSQTALVSEMPMPTTYVRPSGCHKSSAH